MSDGEEPIFFTVIGAKDLDAASEFGTYVTVSIGTRTLFRTRSEIGESPQWNETHPINVSGPQSYSIAVHRETPTSSTADTLLGEITNVIVDSGPPELTLPIESLTGGKPIIITISIRRLEDTLILDDNSNHLSKPLVCLSDFIVKSVSARNPSLLGSAFLSVAIIVNGNSLYETPFVEKNRLQPHWSHCGKAILCSGMAYTLAVICENPPRNWMGVLQLDGELPKRPQEKLIMPMVQDTDDDFHLEVHFTAKVFSQDTSHIDPQIWESAIPGMPHYGLSLDGAPQSQENSLSVLNSIQPSLSSSHDIPSGQIIGSLSNEDQSKAVLLKVLGDKLLEHFESDGSLYYLEQAIVAFRGALLPDGHQDEAKNLWKLGLKLLYERLEKLSDLNDAVKYLDKSCASLSGGKPEKILCLSSLGFSFECQFTRLGEISDLAKAISVWKNAVELIPAGHPTKVMYLNFLGRSYQKQFERLGDISDLEKAISAFKNAVKLTPTGDPDKALYLSNLGNSYQAQFGRLGEISDLETTISTLETAVKLAPTGGHLSQTLNNLGISYHAKFVRLGGISDLEKAISLFGTAVELTPTDHPNKGMYLSNLGDSYRTRFRRLAEISDLEKAISVLENADELTPTGDPSKIRCLNNLGLSYKALFERFGEVSNLEKAISALKNAVELTPIGHPDKAMYLTNLGHTYQTQFEKLEEISVLEKAISVLDNAVELTPTGHPNKTMYLNNLGNSYAAKFERLGEISDLEKAISAKENAVGLTPTGHANIAMYLNNLGTSYHTQFERLGEISDLEKAISVHENAVNLTPTGHPSKAMYLSNLGAAYHTQFERLGEISDLGKAISVLENADKLTPTGDPSKIRCLNNLGLSYKAMFERLGEIPNLEKAISALKNAVGLTPTGHLKKAMYLSNLGLSYKALFERLGEISNLEKAISALKDAVELTPTDHPKKAMYLSNLAAVYHTLFERLGKISELEKALSALENAVDLTPSGDPEKAGYLNSLGAAYHTKFERLGKISDLKKAISARETAVELTPTGHPDKAAYLSNLGGSYHRQFERLGEISDLKKAISALENAIELTPTGHPDKAIPLSNVGASYRAQFERLGDISDLEEAISALEKAVELTPTAHPNKNMYFNNLGNSYQAKFARLGEISDLEKAISVMEKAVNLTPTGHPSKTMFLNNLGASYHTKFDRLGEISDLEKAISVKETAIGLTPTAHPNKAGSLNNLGLSYQTMFEELGVTSDLEKAISALENAVNLTPAGHPGKAMYLSNLGASYRRQFERLGEISQLERAISVNENAVDITPTAHPNKAVYLYNLGLSYQAKFEGLQKMSDLATAIECFNQASQAPTSPPLTRFHAAVSSAKSAEIAGISSIEKYATALHLLPRVAWIGLTIPHRYRLLSEISGVVHDAAIAAISSGKYEIALEWMEQGRSIVWGQVFHLRTPVDDLKSKEPELAAQLLSVSQALDQASAREIDTNTGLSADKIAQKHQLLASQWDKLIQQVHLVPGFEGFLLPKTVSDLIPAANLGPIIAFCIHRTGCHALILKSAVQSVLHIHLPNFSYEKAQKMMVALRGLHQSRFVRQAEFEHEIQIPLSTFEEILSDLWTLVVLPVIDGLKLPVYTTGSIPHIWWCPTGPLAFLPLHAAGLYTTDEPGHKLSDFAISSYTPTVTALLNTQHNLAATTLKILAIAQESNLPNTNREVENLRKCAGLFNVEILKGAQATIDNVVQGMTESTWVHLACHGTQNTSDPTKSAFILADGNLELSRITKMTLPQAEFAFLSACQTAAGHVMLQEEAVHLAAGMLLVGYKSVIATMWAIKDADGPLVAEDIYAELLRNGEPNFTRAAHALHHATQKLRRSGAPFISWVPFIHLGR